MIRHELITPGVGSGTQVVWDLTAGTRVERDAGGVVTFTGTAPTVVADGVKGLGHPKFDVMGQESPRGHGRKRTGMRAKERPVFMPILFSELGEDWAEVQRLFWRCVTPDTPIRWRVTAPDGRVRELLCILDPEEVSYDLDPSIVYAVEPLDMVADDPFWVGDPQSALLAVAGDGTPFFGPSNFGPPLYIQPSSTNGQHRFMVDGDLEAWPVLTLTGPIPAWSVTGLPSGSTVGGVPLLAGDKLVVDFDPTVHAAVRSRSGVVTYVTDQLTQSNFFRLVADSMGGMEVETFVSGTGTMDLTYRPRYWRAV